MKLSQHAYPGTLITDPTAGCGSVVPHMRVHCLCYWPAFPNLEYSGYSPTPVGELLPTQATWAYVSFHCLFQWSFQRFHTLISSLSWDSAFSYIFISPIH